jgi:D-alanyl-D-alanine carboxypeptidase/D-alanyl-D-alanine-endopeptidase (penicillin-binding protein 4)
LINHRTSRWSAAALIVALCASPAAVGQRVAQLPEPVAAALKAANVPTNAVGISVVPLQAAGIGLSLNETVPMNPASTMKLVTTLAGLEILGPQYVWRTEALATAPLNQGVLEGDLYLRGSGDPRLVIEHLWLLAQRLRGVGVREVRGDLSSIGAPSSPQPMIPAPSTANRCGRITRGRMRCCSTTRASASISYRTQTAARYACIPCPRSQA